MLKTIERARQSNVSNAFKRGDRAIVVSRAFWLGADGIQLFHDAADPSRDAVELGREVEIEDRARPGSDHFVVGDPHPGSGSTTYIVHKSCLGPVAPELDRIPERPAVTLDPADPFDAVLVDIVLTNRRKRHDYVAKDASPWSNFDLVEAQVNGTPGLATEVLVATKQARLAALATREGLPQNESVEDTLLDRAVYSVIALGRYRYPDGKVN